MTMPLHRMHALFVEGRISICCTPGGVSAGRLICDGVMGSLDAKINDGSLESSESEGNETKWRISPAEVPT